jgi:hypothetical protein
MKRLFLLAMLFAVSFTAQSETIEDITDVLKYVESEHNPKALGDYRGETPTAFGILQIRKIAIDDVNRVYGTKYRIKDAFDISCAEEIFKLYTDYWSAKLEKREGREVTTADIVRMWNGGPRGYMKTSTKWYLKKFLRYKKRIQLYKNESKTKVLNQWAAGDSNREVFSYSRYLYVQGS